MLVGAPTTARVLHDLAEFIGRDITTALVGHNIRFDISHLYAAHGRVPVPAAPAIFNPICTLSLACQRWPGLPSYKLGDLARHRGIAIEGLHRAAADAELTRRLYPCW